MKQVEGEAQRRFGLIVIVQPTRRERLSQRPGNRHAVASPPGLDRQEIRPFTTRATIAIEIVAQLARDCRSARLTDRRRRPCAGAQASRKQGGRRLGFTLAINRHRNRVQSDHVGKHETARLLGPWQGKGKECRVDRHNRLLDLAWRQPLFVASMRDNLIVVGVPGEADGVERRNE